MELTLAAVMILSLASAGLFFVVGRTVQRRTVSLPAQSAQNAFVTWWYALAILTLVQVLQATGFVAGNLDLAVTLTIGLLASLCVGLWGLMFYLMYLYTASRRALWPLAGAYAAYFLFLVYYVLAQHPVGVEVTQWGARIVYSEPQLGGTLYWAVLALLLVPQMLGALGYLSLYPKVQDPVQRKRVLLVSVSILVWFGSALAGSGNQSSQESLYPLVSKVIALAASATTYYAYAGLKPRAGRPQAAPEPKEPVRPTGPGGGPRLMPA